MTANSFRTARGLAVCAAMLWPLCMSAMGAEPRSLAERTLQSPSWRALVTAINTRYPIEADLVEAESACLAALSTTETEDACLSAAIRSLPTEGRYVGASAAQADRKLTGATPFGSIGIEIGAGTRPGAIRVNAPLVNSPAQDAGLLPGDEIFEIDGRDITGLPMDQAILGFRGAVGSVVRVRLDRKGPPRVVTVDITRDIVHVSRVGGQVLDGNTVVVRIAQFTPQTRLHLAKVLARQHAALGQAPKAVIIDLRGCPGGPVDDVRQALSAFVPAGNRVGWLRDRDGTTPLTAEPLSAEAQQHLAGSLALWQKAPLIVLVDHRTSAGAELFAKVLASERDAILMGTRTAGEVLLTEAVDLPNGAVAEFAVGALFAADRWSWNKVGLLPDVSVATSARTADGADPALDRALQMVRTIGAGR